MRTIGARFILATVIAWQTTTAGARPRLAIRVSPTVSFAPANLVIHTFIEAHASNRAVRVTAVSDEYLRSSEIPLDGGKAPRTSVFEFANLPRGEYDVRAVLKDSRGEELAFAQQRVNVVQASRSF